MHTYARIWSHTHSLACSSTPICLTLLVAFCNRWAIFRIAISSMSCRLSLRIKCEILLSIMGIDGHVNTDLTAFSFTQFKYIYLSLSLFLSVAHVEHWNQYCCADKNRGIYLYCCCCCCSNSRDMCVRVYCIYFIISLLLQLPKFALQSL